MYTLLWSLLLMAVLIGASVVYHHDREKREAKIARALRHGRPNDLMFDSSFTVFAEMSQADDDAWHEYRRARREHPTNKK